MGNCAPRFAGSIGWFFCWILTATPVARSQEQPVFPRPVLIPVEASPGAMIAGDWNGDGRLDLAVLHPSSGKLGVLLHKGPGNSEAPLARPQMFPVGLSPLSVDAGDLDGTNGPDLFEVSSGSGTVGVLLNRCDGTFLVGKTLDVGLSPRVGRLLDLDSDGRLDAVVGTAKSRELQVYLGDGQGSFARQRGVQLGGNPHALAVEDFDGDGIIDVTAVYANSEVGGVQWLGGIGDGTFKRPITTSLEKVDFAVPRLVAPGDFDGDGLVDLGIVTDNALLLSLRFRRGDDFVVSLVGKVPATSLEFVRAVDFDASGRLDLTTPLQVPGGNGVRVWKGEPEAKFSFLGDVLVGGPLRDALWVDIDSDGTLDLVGSQPRPEGVLVVRGTGPGRLGVRATVDLETTPRTLKLVDLDGDSVLDILAVSANSVHFVRAAQAGGFARFARQEFSGRAFEDAAVLSLAEGNRFALALLDLAREEVVVLPLGPAGPAGNPITLAAGDLPRKLAVADLDGDGSSDLAISHAGDSGLRIFLQPVAEGASKRRLDVEVSGAQTALDAGDLDGDGLADLVLGTRTEIVLLLNQGRGKSYRSLAIDGFFAPQQITMFGAERGTPADLAIATGEKVVVLRRPAVEAAPRSEEIRFRNRVETIAVADVTGDSEPDLLSAVKDFVLLSRGVPEGNFAEPESYPVGSSPRGIAVGVLHPDGGIDCTTADSGSRGLSILHGTARLSPQPGTFRRGDSDGSGRVLITDSVITLLWLFRGGLPPVCVDAADVNDSGDVNVSDVVGTLEFLFRSGPPPAPPGPTQCGPDVKADDLPRCTEAGC